MQGWFNIQKPINVIHYVNKIKNQSHIIISIDVKKKHLRKIQHPFMLKTFNKLDIEGKELLQPDQWHLQKILTANIISIGERLNVFPLRSTWQECPLSPLLFNIVLKALTKVISQEEKTKSFQIRKIHLFTYVIIWYMENPKEHTHTQTHTTNY